MLLLLFSFILGMLRDEKSKLPAKGGKRKTSSQIKGSLELPYGML